MRCRFSGCVVALTGKQDWVSDGQTVVRLSNGHEYVSFRRDCDSDFELSSPRPLQLGVITGSGCMTGKLTLAQGLVKDRR